jgi:hypothetical protein
MFVSGNFGADYVVTGVFVEEVDRLFDSFNSNKHAPPFKKLLRPLSNGKADLGVSCWIFLRDGKPAFNKTPPSQNGWPVSIGAVQHVWRMFERGRFQVP